MTSVTTDERTRVLIVDDHMLVREGLRRILQAQDDMEVIDLSRLLAYLMGVMFHFLWE